MTKQLKLVITLSYKNNLWVTYKFGDSYLKIRTRHLIAVK